MKYGKLKVTVDYGDGFTSESNYHAYSFSNDGTDVSCLVDVNSVDHAAQVYYDVDVCANPQGIFGTATNVVCTWTVEPAVTGLYVNHGDNLDDYTEPGVYVLPVVPSDTNVISNVPSCIGSSTFVLEVFPIGGYGQVLQRITRCHKTYYAVVQRCFYSGAWGDWEPLALNDKVNVPFTAPFVQYGNGTEAGQFYAKRDGRMVHVHGVASVKNAITLNTTEATMGTLPEGFRPTDSLYVLMQGSGANKWLLTISPDGSVKASRYGVDSWVELTKQTSSGAGSWLPFSVTFYAA